MTHHTRHLTRALMIAALAAGAWTAAEAAEHHAAHADTQPGIAAEQGGRLGHDLPRQAAAKAQEAVDQALPEPEQDEAADEPSTPPAPPAEPEPTAEPTTPAEPTDDEPVTDDRGTVAPAAPEPTPTETPVEVPPIVVDTPPVVVETPPVVVEPTPTPAPTPVGVPVILPATDLAPLPDASEPVVQPRTLPVPVPALPVQLPVLIGPLATGTTEPPAAVTGEGYGATTEAAGTDPCAQEPRRTTRVDLIGQLIDSLTTPATTRQVKAKPGCPKPGDPTSHVDCVPGTATTNAASSLLHLHADVATTPPTPPLDRLECIRARSALPGSRHVAIEPGPA